MALSHPLIASQAEAAETRSPQALRSPIDLMEPTRLGMLAPLSARLGQSRTQSRAPSRSTSRPLLRGAAAHHLAHSRSSPVYTMEMAARWEATITGQGRPPTSPISPTSPYLGGSPLGRRRDDAFSLTMTTSLGGSPLGRRRDDASSPAQQRISFSPIPSELNSPSRGTSRRQPRAIVCMCMSCAAGYSRGGTAQAELGAASLPAAAKQPASASLSALAVRW